MELTPKQKYREFEKKYLDPVEIEKFAENYLGYVPVDETIREFMAEIVDLIPTQIEPYIPSEIFTQIFEARSIYHSDPILMMHHTMTTTRDMMIFGFLKGAFKF